MKQQNKWSGEVVNAPSLERFKVRLDRALSNLIKLRMPLLTGGHLDYTNFEGPSQTKLFYDFVI